MVRYLLSVYKKTYVNLSDQKYNNNEKLELHR